MGIVRHEDVDARPARRSVSSEGNGHRLVFEMINALKVGGPTNMPREFKYCGINHAPRTLRHQALLLDLQG